MKVLSVAEQVRQLGIGIIGAALMANQYEWSGWVGFAYILGISIYLIGYIMNEDFEL